MFPILFNQEIALDALIQWALTTLLALGGVASLVTALVNILKRFQLLQDGQASSASLGLNLIAFLLLLGLRIFRPDWIAQYVESGLADQIAAVIATLLTGLLGLMGQLGFSRTMHEWIRGIPFVGTSFTLRQK